MQTKHESIPHNFQNNEKELNNSKLYSTNSVPQVSIYDLWLFIYILFWIKLSSNDTLLPYRSRSYTSNEKKSKSMLERVKFATLKKRQKEKIIE